MSKKCVHLNLKILLKSSNHHWSLQQVAFLLLEGFASVLLLTDQSDGC